MGHKTIGEAEANLKQSIAYIPDRYKKGVMAADWATPAGSDEAESNYATAISQAIADGTRQRKIRETSNAVWQAGASGKGAVNIGPGILAGLEKYRSNMSPVLDAMNAASDAAPARTTDYRTNITQRLIPVIEAAKRAAGKSV